MAAQTFTDPTTFAMETKDMNLVTFHDWLLVKFNGDRTKMREFFIGMGFTYKSYLGCSDKLNPEDREGHFKFIEQIVSNLYKDGLIDRAYMASEIAADLKLYERLVSSIVIIKYIDGRQGPEFWKNFWALQARGAVLFISSNVVKFVPGESYTQFLGYKMPRGAEVVTGMTKGIETQDVGSSKFSRFEILDLEQQDTCKVLLEGLSKKMYLSGKGDGSQLVWTVYYGDSMKILRAIIHAKENRFLKLCFDMSLELTNGEAIAIPSTQGTFIESGAMASYMVTSILVGCKITTREELAGFANQDDAWEAHGYKFLVLLLKMPRLDKLCNTHCFMFEAICAKRCGMFGDSKHVEFAIEYDDDRLIFIGYSAVDYAYYIPHMLYSKYWENLGITSPVPFEEPLYWDIDAPQVDAMMEGLNDYVWGKISKAEYMHRFPPVNLDLSNPKAVEDAIIDCEGWVVAANRTFPVIDSLYQKILSLGYELYGEKLPDTSYSKLKTPAYYITHKLKIINLPQLCELAKVAGNIFPILGAINELFAEGALNKALVAIGEEIMEKMDLRPDSEFMQMLMTICEPVQVAGKKPCKNPLSGFEERARDAKCKIVLNLKIYDACNELLLPIYKKYFPSLELNTDGIDSIVRTLTMKLEPWSDKYNENIEALTITTPLLQNLVFACIHTTIS